MPVAFRGKVPDEHWGTFKITKENVSKYGATIIAALNMLDVAASFLVERRGSAFLLDDS